MVMFIPGTVATRGQHRRVAAEGESPKGKRSEGGCPGPRVRTTSHPYRRAPPEGVQARRGQAGHHVHHDRQGHRDSHWHRHRRQIPARGLQCHADESAWRPRPVNLIVGIDGDGDP